MAGTPAIDQHSSHSSQPGLKKAKQCRTSLHERKIFAHSPGSAPYLGSLFWPWQKAREFIRMQKDSRLSRMPLDGWIAMKSLALKTSALLEIFLIQALLYLVLLPLKLIYRAPQPSWNSWFMNQKLCQLDRQYC